MQKDRKEICKILSDMLESRSPLGLYNTGSAFTRLEHLVEKARMEALGWMHAACCLALDKDEDPRSANVADLIKQARNDLDDSKPDSKEKIQEDVAKTIAKAIKDSDYMPGDV